MNTNTDTNTDTTKKAPSKKELQGFLKAINEASAELENAQKVAIAAKTKQGNAIKALVEATDKRKFMINGERVTAVNRKVKDSPDGVWFLKGQSKDDDLLTL